MRARWLKPEFFTDLKIASMGPIVALVYQALWCMADDGGTAPCDPDTVKAQMFYRWSAVGVPEISGALQHLSAARRIVRYQVGDETFAKIPRWNNHQQVHKPSKFRHPVMSQGVALEVPEPSGTTPGNGAAPLPASPPPRHLDTQTPRHLGESVGADAPARAKRVKPEPPEWATRLADRWISRIGGVTPTQIAKQLGPFVKAHGEPALLRAIDGFADARADSNGATPRLAWFVEAASMWVDRTTPKPLVDEHGIPNERGVLALTRPL